MTWFRCTAVAALLLVGCADPPVPIPPECNGAIALCERRFDEVVYPTTHNAMSSAADGFTNPNQDVGIDQQLDDGIRGLMLDSHDFEHQSLLCHGTCLLGSLPLDDGLATIRAFLDRSRGEVVTIIFETYVTAEATATAFADSGLARYVHAQVAGAPWPTLRELIDADTRLVVLTDDDGGGSYPWYLDAWAHAWENPYAAATTDDFSCAVNRGDPANPLFIFNHFLTRGFAVPEEAAATNANPLLIDHAMQCQAASGRLPNFVTVDFYTEGDLFAAVRTLNGVP